MEVTIVKAEQEMVAIPNKWTGKLSLSQIEDYLCFLSGKIPHLCNYSLTAELEQAVAVTSI